MKGLGRNVKLLIGWVHEVQIVVYLILFLVLAFLGIGDKEALPIMVEQIPSLLLFVMFMVVLIVISMGEGDYTMLVYFGSSRRLAAWGILFSQCIFLLEQLVILFVAAVLVENNVCMEIVRACPLGIIAVLLLIVGSGHFINAISLSGHKVCAGILAFASVCVPTILVIYMSAVFHAEISAEMLMPYNNIWILLVGLAVDLIGAVVNFKTVLKADLKLA